MTLSHDDASARLLDLVYGEASPAERAALEAHVATCAACTAELAALGETRARLRVALDDAEAPVPARAHARILEAAAQAIAPVAARAAAPPRGPSFWERLRGKWTLPTLATVGAVAVVVISSKVFLEPEHTMQVGREVATAPPPAATVAPRLAPAEETDKSASGASDRATSELSEEALRRSHLSGSGPHRGLLGSSTFAQRLSHAHATGGRVDQLGALGAGAGAAPAGSAAGAFASPPSGWKGGADGEGSKKREETRERGVGASVAADEAAPAARAASADDVRLQERAAVQARPLAKKSAAPAPAAPPVAVAPKAAAAPEAELEDLQPATSAAAPAKPAADKDEAKVAAPTEKQLEKNELKRDDGSSQEALARRADQLFVAHRWPEAVAAYRELLRRFPAADLEPRWRTRLAQAQSETDAASRATSKAKKVPAEAEPAAR